MLSYRTNEGYTAAVMNADTDTTAELPIITLPGKCVFDSFNDNFVWCGAPLLVENNYLMTGTKVWSPTKITCG